MWIEATAVTVAAKQGLRSPKSNEACTTTVVLRRNKGPHEREMEGEGRGESECESEKEGRRRQSGNGGTENKYP